MKYCILIASRGNPAGLAAVIGAMAQLASGLHEFEFRVTVDDDDAESYMQTTALKRLGYNIKAYCGKRPEGLGSPYNSMAVENNTDIDCFISMTDRTVPLTPDWDDILATTLQKNNDCVLWWHSEPGNQLTLPIIPIKWYRACGFVYPGKFPFWFEDTWLVELNAMVHGLPHKSTALTFHMSRKRKTNRCRDMRFWMDYFIAMGAQRMLHAQKIRANLRLPPMPVADAVQEERRNRYAFWDESCAMFEEQYGDSREPEDSYLRAKLTAGNDMGHYETETFRYLELPA